MALDFRKIHLHVGYVDTAAPAARARDDAGSRCCGIGDQCSDAAIVGTRSWNDPELRGCFACLGPLLGVG